MNTRTWILIFMYMLTQNLIFTVSKVRIENNRANVEKIYASFRKIVTIAANSTDIQDNASLCTRDIKLFGKSVANGENWALKMLDATSIIQSGILKGNVHNLGMYDQCVEVVARQNSASIQGQHCLVSISVLPNSFGDISSVLSMQKISPLSQSAGSSLSLSSSVCLPSSCNEEDVFAILNKSINIMPELVESGTRVSQVRCSRISNDDFTLGETLTIASIMMIVVLLLFCTICDFIQRTGYSNDSSSVINTLEKFSLYANATNLLNTKITPDRMPAINGLRVLSLCWVLIVHRCLITAMSPVANSTDFIEWQNKWYGLFAFMIGFIVDTSFVISGFLTTKNFFKSTNSREVINLPKIYFHRYLRLAPCLIILVLLTTFCLRRIGSGPIWRQSIEVLVDSCEENWWTNILFVQNIINPEKMCLPHTWYLAADMQLFWISHVIIYLSFRWKSCSKNIIILFSIATLIMSPTLFAVNGYTSHFFKLTSDTNLAKSRENITNAYMFTVHRVSPYLVGILLGYITAKTKLHLSKAQVAVNWTIAFILILFCTIATHHLYNETYVYNVIFESAYAALTRPAWSIAIAWIIYACTQGYGGPVTTFLSTPIFLPLSRLSYGIYLVHFVMQILTVAVVRAPIIFSKFQMFHMFWGDLATLVGLSFLLHIFIEAPFITLEKNWNYGGWNLTVLMQKLPKMILKIYKDEKVTKVT